MKYCTNCGLANEENANFCAKCGRSLLSTETLTNEQNSSWVNHLNDYVGNNRPADLNWKVLFSDVLKKHTREEAEEIFICGTKTTTPSLEEVSKEWPHPWLYSRVFAMFAIAFGLLYVCCSVFGNINTLPGFIVVGAFTVPLTTLILFLEVNAYKNVSIYDVGQTFLIGGCASLVATLLLFSIIGGSGELDFFGAFLVGVIEELGKAVIVYYFIKRMNKFSILPALLIGASVGAGFAAFESAGYALRVLIDCGWEAMMDNIILRGILSPGGHVAWAAITGAALVIASKELTEFSTSVFTNKRFLRLFLIPVLLHAAWDSPLAAIGFEIYLVPILLTIFVWIVVLILINMGLSEIAKFKTN